MTCINMLYWSEAASCCQQLKHPNVTLKVQMGSALTFHSCFEVQPFFYCITFYYLCIANSSKAGILPPSLEDVNGWINHEHSVKNNYTSFSR